MNDDDNSLTLEKLKQLADSLPAVPRIEIQIGPGQANAFMGSLQRTFFLDRKWPPEIHTLSMSRLGDIPIVERDIYPRGLGAYIEYQGSNQIPALVFLLDWRTGTLKVFKIADCKEWLTRPMSGPMSADSNNR